MDLARELDAKYRAWMSRPHCSDVTASLDAESHISGNPLLGKTYQRNRRQRVPIETAERILAVNEGLQAECESLRERFGAAMRDSEQMRQERNSAYIIAGVCVAIMILGWVL